jgi:hypothetical protein
VISFPSHARRATIPQRRLPLQATLFRQRPPSYPALDLPSCETSIRSMQISAERRGRRRGRSPTRLHRGQPNDDCAAVQSIVSWLHFQLADYDHSHCSPGPECVRGMAGPATPRTQPKKLLSRNVRTIRFRR